MLQTKSDHQTLIPVYSYLRRELIQRYKVFVSHHLSYTNINFILKEIEHA